MSRSSRRSSRNRRNGRRGQKGSLLKTLLLGSAVALVPISAIGIGGYLAYVEAGKETMTANYCFPRRDQHTAVFFVDFSHTQQTSRSQRSDLEHALLQLYARMPANGQVAVFTTAEGGSTVNEPEFVLCKPPSTAREMERIGAPVTSPMRLERLSEEAREAFESQIDDLLTRSVSSDQQAGYSPILEQVRGISRYDFGAPLDHLTIYTDGINNSPIAQFCAVQGHLPRFEVFAQRPDYHEIAPDNFDGANVDILLVEAMQLPNPVLQFCTHRELRDFWTSLFEANDASSVRLTPLGYGSGS